MKQFIICLCLCALFSTAFAQEKVYENSLQKGKFALQYGISGGILEDMSLTSFNGSVFSGKYQFCEKNAVRFGLNATYSHQDVNQERTYDPNQQPETRNILLTSSDIAFNLQFVHYLAAVDNFFLYFGAGPTLGLGKLTSEAQYSDIESENSRESRYVDAGLKLLCGTEWFVRKNISLTAEYNSYAYYSWQKTKTSHNNIDQSNDENKEFRFSYNTVLLGISFYF